MTSTSLRSIVKSESDISGARSSPEADWKRASPGSASADSPPAPSAKSGCTEAEPAASAAGKLCGISPRSAAGSFSEAFPIGLPRISFSIVSGLYILRMRRSTILFRTNLAGKTAAFDSSTTARHDSPSSFLNSFHNSATVSIGLSTNTVTRHAK